MPAFSEPVVPEPKLRQRAASSGGNHPQWDCPIPDAAGTPAPAAHRLARSGAGCLIRARSGYDSGMTARLPNAPGLRVLPGREADEAAAPVDDAVLLAAVRAADVGAAA